MDGRFDSRNALVALVDEVSRLNGRLKSVFAETRRTVGLGESEMMVLNAVVEAERPPTASQIGRSLGVPRQLIQRAAYALAAEALIETRPNPDHKRAALLVATAAGRALKQRADRAADQIAADLARDLDMTAAASAVHSLRGVRKALETQLRNGRG
jgi:DNA-binding MarR family transcriptional regulator